MSVTTVNKTKRVIIPVNTPNAANSTLLGAPVDLRTKNGGYLTLKIANSGALGAQAVMTVLTAADDGATPAAALEGDVWKRHWQFGNGLLSGTTTPQNIPIPQGVQHLNVSVTGNTTNAVVCEAIFSEVTSATSV